MEKELSFGPIIGKWTAGDGGGDGGGYLHDDDNDDDGDDDDDDDDGYDANYFTVQKHASG